MPATSAASLKRKVLGWSSQRVRLGKTPGAVAQLRGLVGTLTRPSNMPDIYAQRAEQRCCQR